MMNRSMKVAISLPEHVLVAVEKERKTSGESRSEFFRRAAEKLLKQQQEARVIEKYIQGYCDKPESIEEVKAIHRSGTAVLAQEPW
jgi:metal-responsive CopG/Arc/MetJ family transcriptional regulator